MNEPLHNQRRSPLASALLWVMVVVLVVAGLLLPPISLGKRLLNSDFVKLDADNARVSHPDGFSLAVDPALLAKAVRVKLDSVPRLNVVDGQSPEDWREAAAALPTYLVLKSPLYGIAFEDETDLPAHVEVVIPNEAEPYRLLDMYAWDGSAWHWVPSTVDSAGGLVVADLTSTPKALALLQATALSPVVGMSANLGESVPPETGGLVTELYPAGMALGPAGSLLGQPVGLNGGAGMLQIPISLSSDSVLVQALLGDAAASQAHAETLVNAVVAGNFAGLNLDYAGVPAAQRDAFSNFVRQLADGLHGTGRQLVVTVPSPAPASGGWDTAGYDWIALGAIADRLVVVLPLNPAAYAQNGLVDQLLTWAVTQVNRYKLMAGINTIGIQQVNGVFTPVHTAEALAPLASSVVRMDPGPGELEPGHQVVVGVPVGFVMEDAAIGTYRVTYPVGAQMATSWLTSPAALSSRLRVFGEYYLGGLVLNGLAGSEMAGELVAAVNSYLAAALPPASPPVSLAWVVTGADGQALSQSPGDLNNPQYTWQAVDAPGSYSIKGQLAIGQQTAELGAVQVSVKEAATPTLEPSPEPTATPQVVASGGSSGGTQAGSGDAVVSGSLVNLREGPGTVFRTVGQLKGGTALQILAVNPDSTWLKIKAPDGTVGWIFRQLCTVNVSLSDRAVEDVPTPTPAPTPEGGAPPPPVVAPVSGGSFELGGHIRTWNYLGQMASAGMNWVKVQVHYGQDASGLVGLAHGNGFKIQLSALGSRDMVSQPNFHANYGAWVSAMAATGADAIEVWNEPNIDAEWPLGQISPTAYTQLLCSAYNAIKSANPGTAVISAAPAPTGYFGGCSGNGCDDLPWLQGLVNAGAANCMDYIGAHHNAGATRPSATSGHPADGGGGHHSWYFLPQTQLYYNVFGGARKLFYTEMGYASQEGVPEFSDWFAWARGITNANQAAWLAEAASLSSSTGMVRCLIVWNIDFARYGADPQDGYAIIRPDGSCPACASLGAVMGR